MKIRRQRSAVVAVVAVLLASAGWWQFARRDVPEGQARLATLDAANLAILREQFNAASDAARVIVLLSPT